MDNLEHSNHKQRLQMVMLLCFLVYFVGFSFISRKYPAVQPAPETLEKAESVSADGPVSSKITSTEPKQNKTKQVTVAPSFEKLPRKDVDISNEQSTANVRSDTGSISNIVLKEYTKNYQLLPQFGDGCLVVHLTALSPTLVETVHYQILFRIGLYVGCWR